MVLETIYFTIACNKRYTFCDKINKEERILQRYTDIYKFIFSQNLVVTGRFVIFNLPVI